MRMTLDGRAMKLSDQCMPDMGARDWSSRDTSSEIVREGNPFYCDTLLEGDDFPPEPLILQVLDTYCPI